MTTGSGIGNAIKSRAAGPKSSFQRWECLNLEGAHMLNRTAIIAVTGGLFIFPITAYADAASEIATAAQHAGLAAAAPNLAQTRMQLHQVMNCLVGPLDGDFDKTAGNPCAQQGKGAYIDETNPDIKVKLQSAMSLVADGIAAGDEAAAKNNATTAAAQLGAIK
jgi:hypothetical protein